MSITAIVLICLAAGYYLIRPRKKVEKSRATAGRSPGKDRGREISHNAYHAVSISHKTCGCRDVRAMGNRRFLATRPPLVPLATCNAETCKCTYIHYEDRRVPGVRRAPYNVATDLHAVAGRQERRARKSRRETDQQADMASDFDFEDIEWIT